MNKRQRLGFIFAGAFAVLGTAILVWFVFRPVDQLIMLGILSLPASAFFPFVFPLTTPPVVQGLIAITVGMVQYYLIGYGISVVLNRPRQ
jgi:hypothetical protein